MYFKLHVLEYSIKKTPGKKTVSVLKKITNIAWNIFCNYETLPILNFTGYVIPL